MSLDEECRKVINSVMVGEIYDENGSLIADTWKCACDMAQTFIGRGAITLENLYSPEEKQLFTNIVTNFILITINNLLIKADQDTVEKYRDAIFNPLLAKFNEKVEQIDFVPPVE